MLNGDIIEGKTGVLNYITSVVKDCHKQRHSKSKIDCFGSEYSRCLHAFRHVWKLQLILKCDSEHCPIVFTQRQQTTYSINPLVSLEKQIREHFPYPGERIRGYCGADFKQTPPINAPSAATDRCDIDNPQKRITFYQCRGNHVVQSSQFTANSIWMLPFDISSVKSSQLSLLRNNISVYGAHYQLAGYSLHQGNHFTSVVFWNGKPYVYDGMNAQGKLIPYSERRLSKRTMGSYAYFLAK